MDQDRTPRLALPLLWAGQAQKEIFHNEALTLLDLAIGAGVAKVGATSVPDDPQAGDAWIVGAGATDEWAGRTDMLAGWTEGGWRFVWPVEGMTVWSRGDATFAQFRGDAWVLGELAARRILVEGKQVIGARLPAIASAEGGTTIDEQARAALNAVVAALQKHGLIATE